MYSAILLGAALLAQTSQGGDLLDVQESGIPVSGGTASGGVAISGACATYPSGDVYCYDNDGVKGGNHATDVQPTYLLLGAQSAWAGAAAKTGADVYLVPGFGIYTDTIGTYTSCTGAVTTATINGSALTCTEGVDYSAITSNAVTAAALAVCLDAKTGITATSSAAVVRVQVNQSEMSTVPVYSLALSRDTAGCDTAANGTDGQVLIKAGSEAAPALAFAREKGTGMYQSGTVRIQLATNGTQRLLLASSTSSIVSGTIQAVGKLVSTNSDDIGWSIVTGANTACNTTCTNACVFGWDTAAPGVLLACTDATSDSCLCAGSS